MEALSLDMRQTARFSSISSWSTNMSMVGWDVSISDNSTIMSKSAAESAPPSSGDRLRMTETNSWSATRLLNQTVSSGVQSWPLAGTMFARRALMACNYSVKNFDHGKNGIHGPVIDTRLPYDYGMSVHIYLTFSLTSKKSY